jgi:glycosyltransferase involved in cell wall biosynthesis
MPALRAAAGLARLDPTFRIVLLGSPTVLQPLRLFAAALRVAQAVDVRPAPPLEAAWPASGWPPIASDEVIPAHTGDAPVALWTAGEGDDGTTYALAAAQAGVPLLVASDHELAPTVRQHDAGFVMPVGSPQADALAASTLAALRAHHDERQRLRQAAHALAATYDATGAVDRVLRAIQRLSTAHVS